MYKKGIISIVVLSFLAFSAQGQRSNSRKLDRQTQSDQRYIRLAEKLALSPDQRKELYELFQEEKKYRRAERRNTRPSQEERRAARRELNEKVSLILNETQLEEYLFLQEKKEVKRIERVEQRKKVKTYHEENINPVLDAQRLKLDGILSDEEKSIIEEIRVGKGDQSAGGKKRRISKDDRAVLKVIANAHRSEIKALMSQIATQRKVWKADLKELKKHKRGKKNKEPSQKDKNKRSKTKRVKNKRNGKVLQFLLREVD